MRDAVSRLRLATIRALEAATAFVAGPKAVAHKAARAEAIRQRRRADAAEHRETLTRLVLRDLVRACDSASGAGLTAALTTARTLLGEPPADALLTEGDPLYVPAAGCERCGNDPGSRHGTCADVAPDDDEPAIGDEPTLVSQ